MTNSSSWRGPAGDCLRATGVLVSTATERVVDNVHRDTPDAWPVGCCVRHLVVLVTGLHKRFLNAAAACNNTDSCTAAVVEPLGFAAWHPDTDPVSDLIDDYGLDS